MKKVPLVIYDAEGKRTVIGAAEVEIIDSDIYINAQVTDPKAASYFAFHGEMSVGTATDKTL